MSRSWVSPGVAYLSRGLLSVVVPAASAVIIVVRLASLKGVRVSPWLMSAVVLGAAPLGFAAYILADEISQQRKAKRLGARLIPRVKGKWPGNLDKIVTMVMKTENEYLGTTSFHAFCSCFMESYFCLGRPIEDEIKVLGPTINFRFFWEDLILTTEPQHIKASF